MVDNYKKIIQTWTDKQVTIALVDHTSLAHKDKKAVAVLEAECKRRNIPIIHYKDFNPD